MYKKIETQVIKNKKIVHEMIINVVSITNKYSFSLTDFDEIEELENKKKFIQYQYQAREVVSKIFNFPDFKVKIETHEALDLVHCFLYKEIENDFYQIYSILVLSDALCAYEDVEDIEHEFDVVIYKHDKVKRLSDIGDYFGTLINYYFHIDEIESLKHIEQNDDSYSKDELKKYHFFQFKSNMI